jgi:hypothetical protein
MMFGETIKSSDTFGDLSLFCIITCLKRSLLFHINLDGDKIIRDLYNLTRPIVL